MEIIKRSFCKVKEGPDWKNLLKSIEEGVDMVKESRSALDIQVILVRDKKSKKKSCQGLRSAFLTVRRKVSKKEKPQKKEKSESSLQQIKALRDRVNQLEEQLSQVSQGIANVKIG